MQMPGRYFSSDGYRYGYQGSEMDNELKGNGNFYTTFYRGLDPRVARWITIDPMANKFPWQSPYISMDNNPILLTDVLGSETDPPTKEIPVYNVNLPEVNLPVAYNKEDLAVRNAHVTNGWNSLSAIGRGILASERDGKQLHLGGSAAYKGFGSAWKQGASGLSSDAKALMDATTYGVGGSLLAVGILEMGLVSLKGVVVKGSISLVTQALINKGNVNWFAVGSDAIFAPGFGRVVGNAVEVNSSIFDVFNVQFQSVGYNKSTSRFVMESTTSFLIGTKSDKLGSLLVGKNSTSYLSQLIMNTSSMAQTRAIQLKASE